MVTTGSESVQAKPSPSRFSVLAACLVVLVGCEASETPPDDIAIPPGTPVAIESTPLVAVGVAQGDSLQEFGRVVTPFALPGDRLVVPDQIARVLRIFDFQGTHLETLGSPGEGPGEFSNFLIGAWPRGDTIEAFDFGMMRLTQFLPDGSVEVVSVRPDRAGYGPVPGALPDGWVLSGVQNTGPDRPARSRDQIELLKIAGDGSPLEQLAETSGIARYADSEGNRLVEPLSPRGQYVIRGGKLYVGETLTPTIRRYDSDGNLEVEISWEATAPMDPAAAFSVVSDSAVARATSEDEPAVRRRFRDAPAPEALSVFWEFLVDDEGFVWVLPYDPVRHAHALGGWSGPGPGGTWRIFSPEGREVGTVDVPQDLVPMDVGTDAIVGIVRDDLGVQSVRVHAVRRH